jgi:hypothetical protein
MKKFGEFRRNCEFDRIYWDDHSSDRMQTTQQASNKALKDFYASNESRQILGDNESVAISTASSTASSLTRDTVSTLFAYPSFKKLESASHDYHTFDVDSQAHVRNMNKRHCIKRNQYSDYNEQRIKFGLKFY